MNTNAVQLPDNVIQIHNSVVAVVWDWQYFTKCSRILPTFNMNVEKILWNIVSAT